MTRQLVECVPNFSEGRDLWKVDAIVATIRAIAGVELLGQESDFDHNRSVVTFTGEPAAVGEAALEGVRKAAELIDLNRHTGVHPRIGAIDVLPFIPLEGITMGECAALARHVGEEIWRHTQIPVYFYEAAADDPKRAGLEIIRRGGFEALREQALLDSTRRPDIGGPGLHPTAGAIAVGARQILIAFNVNLKSQDLEAAKEIARKIRQSSGGLPHLKAMGVRLESRNLVQVSMNLTDYRVTPLHVAFEAVQTEARRLGIGIEESELVGFVPRKALEQSAAYFLHCRTIRISNLL